MVAGYLEFQLATGQLAVVLGQGKRAVGLLSHVVLDVGGIPLGTKYRSGGAGYGIGLDGHGRNLIAINFAFVDVRIEGEHILTAVAGQFVGFVTALGCIHPFADDYHSVTARRTMTESGVKCVPV